MSVETEREQHPFFHTMVVMGSALALGCGGMSSSAEPDRTGSGGGGGSGGSGGGTGGSGGSGSTGGTGGTGSTGGTGTGAAGTGGSGGSIIINAGTGGQGPVEPGPFTCSPAQWACSEDYSFCATHGYRLPDDCDCDETRPKTAADCADGEVLACRHATHSPDYVEFTESVPFDCHCVKEQVNCEAACDLLYPSRGTCYDQFESTGGKTVLCGCAVIVLR